MQITGLSNWPRLALVLFETVQAVNKCYTEPSKT